MELYRLLRIASRVAEITGARNKGLLKGLQKKYPNVPDYVMHEIYSGDTDKIAKSGQMESILKAYNAMEWKLQTVELHWDKFNKITQSNFRRRKLGLDNPDGVPNDVERLKRQIDSLAGDGKNEPMIFLETGGGLELVEGFHRTMALLLKGAEDLEKTFKELDHASDNGVDALAKKWKPVSAKAWVGKETSESKDEEIEMGDWQS